MRGQNFLPATASPADSKRSILILHGNLETDQHLYLALLFHRDYFDLPDASLSGSFVPQGLFRPVRCISILLFCSTGIISTGRMHLYLALLLHRDYFSPVRCISILLFCSTGIISTSRMHLYHALLLHKDYFDRSDASLSCSFAPQGLFPPARCISILLFYSTGIISPQSDTSPIAENISASPFRQLPVFELKQSVFIFFITS